MRLPYFTPLFAPFLVAGCVTLSPASLPPPPVIPQAPTPKPAPTSKPIKVGLALGGGAARGFAHIGVIKVLEAQGLTPDIIVGTRAGAVVGALYASGNNGCLLYTSRCV